MPSSSLRFRLRERTASRHAAVDEAVGAFKTQSDYRRYLAGLHAFRAPFEAAIAAGPLPADADDWEFAPLVPLIEADMADLGLLVPAGSAVLGQVPPVATLEEAAGRLYVLEGSALGARVLVVEARALGLDERFGARHLVAQSRGGAAFGTFAAWLDRAALDEDAVVTAAVSTFVAAERAFAAPDAIGFADALA